MWDHLRHIISVPQTSRKRKIAQASFLCYYYNPTVNSLCMALGVITIIIIKPNNNNICYNPQFCKLSQIKQKRSLIFFFSFRPRIIINFITTFMDIDSSSPTRSCISLIYFDSKYNQKAPFPCLVTKWRNPCNYSLRSCLQSGSPHFFASQSHHQIEIIGERIKWKKPWW